MYIFIGLMLFLVFGKLGIIDVFEDRIDCEVFIEGRVEGSLVLFWFSLGNSEGWGMFLGRLGVEVLDFVFEFELVR